MDSGLARVGSWVVGTGLDLNASTRDWTEPDLSRILRVSGEDSREIDGEASPRVRELALSAMDGDLEGARTLAFLTEKKEVDAVGVGPMVLGGVLAPAPSFSNAFIRWEIPEPRLTFFASGWVDCLFIWSR
jgi:hypothetical protein